MNEYEKLKTSGSLVALTLAGFTVRGFKKLSSTRGGGSLVEAASITREGDAVTKVYIGAMCKAGLQVDWMDSDKTEQLRVYDVAMSDDGGLRLAAASDGPAAVPVPKEAVWQ